MKKPVMAALVIGAFVAAGIYGQYVRAQDSETSAYHSAVMNETGSLNALADARTRADSLAKKCTSTATRLPACDSLAALVADSKKFKALPAVADNSSKETYITRTEDVEANAAAADSVRTNISAAIEALNGELKAFADGQKTVAEKDLELAKLYASALEIAPEPPAPTAEPSADVANPSTPADEAPAPQAPAPQQQAPEPPASNNDGTYSRNNENQPPAPPAQPVPPAQPEPAPVPEPAPTAEAPAPQVPPADGGTGTN
ncbi:hypothetical protein J2S49_001312 [Arcanobacterium wilhelmae]|uniref:Uncharacterized protein n=1 Tax=Arcanobacterium wilhelmae TaxID=1803177 RepID=A0ABT9NBZ3_9ACTO|nr:hypothetical protein [Arcanobacterium wilhelmae]MDP9801236.1 hypothetical protein [Arcanobacterium wilhelmae]WFN90586.1 hypothetical protein P8A24_01630 [Arcanobacterium wilhelmae]